MKKINSDPTFKGAMGRPLMKVIYLNQMSPKENRNHICKDVFMTISVVIFTKKDFYLLDKINNEIGKFQASGLIDFWHNQNVNREVEDKDKRYPTVLKLTQLLSCFQLLFVGFLVSFLIFISEIFLKLPFFHKIIQNTRK